MVSSLMDELGELVVYIVGVVGLAGLSYGLLRTGEWINTHYGADHLMDPVFLGGPDPVGAWVVLGLVTIRLVGWAARVGPSPVGSPRLDGSLALAWGGGLAPTGSLSCCAARGGSHPGGGTSPCRGDSASPGGGSSSTVGVPNRSGKYRLSGSGYPSPTE